LRSALGLVVFGLALALSSGATAQAGELPRVTLVQEPCTERTYDRAAFAALLQIELQPLGVHVVQVDADAQRDAQLGLALMHVRCGAEPSQLGLELADLASRKQVVRTLRVNDVEPSARPRALALSVALLIQSSWAEIALSARAQAQPQPLPEPVRRQLIARLRTAVQPVMPPVPPPPRAAKARELPTSIALSGVLRAFPARNTGLLGGELSISHTLAPLRLGFGVEGLYGSLELSDQNGRIADIGMYWITAGAQVLWASATQPQLAIGPFVRAGYARAHGRSRREGVATIDMDGFVSAIGLCALLSARVGSAIEVWLGADLGYVPNGVVFLADLSRPAGMAEATLSTRAGASLAF